MMQSDHPTEWPPYSWDNCFYFEIQSEFIMVIGGIITETDVVIIAIPNW